MEIVNSSCVILFLYWLDKGSISEREEARIRLSFFKDPLQLKNQMKRKEREEIINRLQNSEINPCINERSGVIPEFKGTGLCTSMFCCFAIFSSYLKNFKRSLGPLVKAQCHFVFTCYISV